MSGRLRNKLTLQTRTEAIDAYGDATLTYTDLTKEWGSIESVTARERSEAQQVQAEVSHRITIRSNPTTRTLSADDRVTFGSRTFDIVTPIDVDGRGRYLDLLAVERL